MKKSKYKNPPYLAVLLIKLFFPDGGSYSTLGDIIESYFYILKEQGLLKAKLWFWSQVLKSIFPIITNSIFGAKDMLSNYIKIAYRNLLKYKTYSFINVIGLSLGLTCCILIYLYSVDELSFDKFHKDKNDIYRLVNINYDAEGNTKSQYAYTPAVMRENLKEFFGNNIESTTTIMKRNGILKLNNNSFEETINFVESNFFETFSFPLIIGNKEVVLKNESSIVITKEMAIKYFGDDDPINKEIEVLFGDIKKSFLVTGVSENPPSNSSIQFKLLVKIENQKMFYTDNPNSYRLKNLGDFSAQNYVKVKTGLASEFFNKQFERFVKKYFAKELSDFRKFGNIPEDKMPFNLYFQNIQDIHFDSTVYGGNSLNSLYILIGIALIVLVISCINFMNLSIGRSSIRFREIGVRKVIGASRKQIGKQFWSESVITTLISLVFGIIISIFVLPIFNELTEKTFKISDFITPINFSAIFLISLFVGIIAGSYPAIIMSRFNVVDVMKGQFKFGGKNKLTKSLVVLQFALSIFLIISTLILKEQISFMLNKDLGYNQESVISVRLLEKKTALSHKTASLFSNAIKENPNIKNTSIVSEAFGVYDRTHSPIYYNTEKMFVRRINVDYNFLQTLKVDLLSGRNFSKDFSLDSSSVIINEACLKKLNENNPIGKEIKLFDRIPLKIIGVVKDFNFDSVEEEIIPAILYVRPDFWVGYALVKINPVNISETITFIEKKWREINPEKPFLYSFMDDDLKTFYDQDKKWNSIIGFSSLFSIIIACLGIFGLTTITINRKVKEIGIRKVLGASISQIVKLILSDFIFLIVIANIITWPFVYYVMNKTLQNYFYRIEITADYFLLTGLISLLLAVFTILFLAIKSAINNPVQSLRSE